MAREQFRLGPAASPVTVRFWADTDVIHLLIAGLWLQTSAEHLVGPDGRRPPVDLGYRAAGR